MINPAAAKSGASGGAGSLVSEAAARKLHETTELDYMTHIVFRMYENKRSAAPLISLSLHSESCRIIA